MKLQHLRGLDQDLARQTKQAKKMGGPSDALKRLKKRPGGQGTNRDGYCFMNGRGLVVCNKCGEKKLNGYLKENLCEDCYDELKAKKT